MSSVALLHSLCRCCNAASGARRDPTSAAAAASQDAAGRGQPEERGVERRLSRGESTEDDVFRLGREQFPVDLGGGRSVDEAGGDARELLPARRAESSFLLGGVLITRSLDGSAEDFAELRGVPEQPRAREVHHGEKFPEVILDGRAREQHPPVASKPTKRGDGLRVSPDVLQPVRLVAHEQIDAPVQLAMTSAFARSVSNDVTRTVHRF